MPILRITALIFICFWNVACSSGGGDAPAAVPEKTGYALMLERGNLLQNRDDDNKNEIPVIPTRGIANYSGTANLNQNGDSYADITLTADFAEDTISGHMDNFTTPDNAKINGYADITQGKITGPDFSARLSGTYDGAKLTGDMDGRFIGKRAELVDGNFRTKIDGKSYRGNFTAKK